MCWHVLDGIRRTGRKRGSVKKGLQTFPHVASAVFDEEQTDGFVEEMRSMALGLVLQLDEDPSGMRAQGHGDALAPTGCTFRLAQRSDIPADALRLFHAETEAYLSRTLNRSVFVGLVERGGEAVSMSGLEAADRMPVISAHGGAQRAATVIACYTPPQHRGKGYMRRMLAAWTSMAPMLGLDTLYMETHNHSMRHLALAAGYEHVSDKFRLSLPTPDVFPHGGDPGARPVSL